MVEEKGEEAITARGAAEAELDKKQKEGLPGLDLASETIYFNFDSAGLSAEAREAAYRNPQDLMRG